MTNLTLKQLRYFEALARQGHFGRAADVSGVTQPALSVQIRDLEASLGAALFERSARRVQLTAFGEDFAVRVRDILRAVDELGELARASKGGLSGRLRVGVIPTIAPYLLPSIISGINQSFPELDVHVRETLTDRLLEELVDGRLDTAILALPISDPALEEVELFEENLLLVRPKSDAGKPAPDRESLKAMRLLLLEEGHCFRDQALSFCNIQSSQTREGLDGSSLSTLVQMVDAGIGVTFIPEMAAAVESRSASVSLARFADPQPSRRIGMIWRRSSPLAKQLQQLSNLVRDAAEAVRTQPLGQV